MEPGKEDAQTDCRRKKKGRRVDAESTIQTFLAEVSDQRCRDSNGSPADAGAVAPAGDTTTGMERGEIGRLAAAFKRSFSVPSLSVAISRNGQFVFDQGFGFNQGFRFGNVKDMGPTDMSSLFRIADVTMPITSVAIFTLVEQGKLNLTDKVFGASGILGTKYGKSPYGQYVTDITVDHLLTHTCGGWPADSTDPMYKDNSWDQAKLIGWTLENLPLSNPPGEHWAFSNFGYCLLGRVIEQVTGQPYASYVQSAVLAPCGINGMRIAGNSSEGPRPQRSCVLRAIQ